MSSKKLLFGVAAAILFVVGAGYIIYQGRPVMKIAPSPSTTQGQPSTPASNGAETTVPSGSGAMGTYSLTDVQTHKTETDCWSAINGNVYDLTSWISRHPGGTAPIIGLCGTDGTIAFTNQHGTKSRPVSMLALLKIGSLK